MLVKLNMNRLYGEQIRKDNEDSCHCKSELWMITEYDERVLDYQKISHGIYIMKMEGVGGVQDDV